MQYFGGKAKLAPKIVPVLQAYADTHAGYWEPFCGALNTFVKVKHEVKIASDACSPLIELYWHIQLGCELPEVVTEDDYAHAKRGECEPWYQAFVGFGCSFAGKWFGGYARRARGDNSCSFSAIAKRSLRQKFYDMGDGNVTFLKATYDTELMDIDCAEGGFNGPAWLIYCDPPYAGTTGYGAVGKWDAATFWAWARRQARVHTVLVSEYACPVPHELVAEWAHSTQIRTGKSGDQHARVERLFKVLP